jgi:hypothetical protein
MTHRDATPSRGTSPDRTERELSETLAALADGVRAAPTPTARPAASGCAASAGAGSSSPC